jgi:RNA polymerase sigma-70 factor (subfamily 1)
MPTESDWDPNVYRSWLKLQARLLRRDPRLNARLDDSDIVQDTLARAVAKRGQFRGSTEPERLAWLQAILNAVTHDALDHHLADKRDATREQSIDAALIDATRRLDTFLQATCDQPGDAAMRRELWRDAVSALEQLPQRERDVVVAHDIEGRSLRQIEAEMGIAKSTAAELLIRGRRLLAEQLAGHK